MNSELNAVEAARNSHREGGDPDSIRRLLMNSGGMNEAQADALLHRFEEEDKGYARADASKKIVLGVSLIPIPLTVWGIMEMLGVLDIKLLAVACVPGLYGIHKLVDGAILWFRPDAEIDEEGF